MKSADAQNRIVLENGATVAVVGGGPAGSFFVLHLLRWARLLGRRITVVIFERRRQPTTATRAAQAGAWRGCNFCAGGISPKLVEALRDLDLEIPDELVQGRVRSITIEGYWKNIEFDVPEGREILSVYRGSQPTRRDDHRQSFDCYLLDQAIEGGAQLIGAEVDGVQRSGEGKPVVSYRMGTVRGSLEADFVVFAAGVNQAPCVGPASNPLLRSVQSLIPDYVPPRVRSALIFELEVEPRRCAALDGQLHFVEYGSKTLRLEMCSLLPKRGYVTAVLVGGSVDAVTGHSENPAILREFLELPHIGKLLTPHGVSRVGCSCNPSMVVGTARNPIGDRAAVVGDLATSRLYKDGILSASQTAEALAETLLSCGLDRRSLERGYLPVVRRFRRDNRFAATVFLLHRIFFSSSVLSRVLYQAVITERKNKPHSQRRLERILWEIASGDAQYEDVFRAMIHPATAWQVLTGGLLLTFRNHLTEVLFGLRWERFGRFTTGVAQERLQTKRAVFSGLIAESGAAVPARPEFERMYTIRIHAPPDRILDQLGRFGEPDRRYLRPRGVRIDRVAGHPNEPGCVIRYTVLFRHFRYHLVLNRLIDGRLVVYRVRDGFARGGVLIFEIEETGSETCALSIYVAFNFRRGGSWWARSFWFLFRYLFPSFVHDVLWNHSLCVLKDVVETDYQASIGPANVVASLNAQPCEAEVGG